eukprot:TRINITY_DN10145_c0_g1_i2.p2 TRINITY_DN10145_c0_g1~~TRINITY_DN10145_c0_g1_i2.p2  ORF type:complete len:123 (-),score=23.45 TRINITY_DN10145_c0_g1_i2:3-371(-)
MIRRPPRSTLSSSSAASDVYKRQEYSNSLMSTVKHSAFTQYMGFPTFLDHIPVCIIAVHGDNHSSTTTGNLSIEAFIIDACKELFKRIKVIEGTKFTNISSIKQCMHTNLGDTFLFLSLIHI